MRKDIEESMTSRKRAMIKASILVVFILVAIYVIRFTSVKEFLTQEALGHFLESAGFWAPLAFVAVYTAGICLFVPGTLLTALGAAIFGAYWGFLYVWIGAMAGASAAFWIGRTLGREFAASLIGDRLKKYDDAIERNGFATVLYLRLIYFPFTADELWDGTDEGSVLGLLLGHRTGHPRRYLHFYFFCWNPERGLGQR